jgi:hypothetical protein
VSRLFAERSERVDAVGCGYSCDRDAARVDVAGTSAAKLFGREGEGEWRDAGYREEQDKAPLARGFLVSGNVRGRACGERNGRLW